MGFWNLVNKVMHEADILLIVLDARMPMETRNEEIERKVEKLGKPLIYVINKSDLVDRNTLSALKRTIPKSVFVSATKHQGMNFVRARIGIEAKRSKLKDTIKVGILGYPNVGKSSLINSLRGRASAPVSNISGHTKSIRNVKASSNIILLDTPGVLPFKEKDDMKHAMIGTIDYNKEKEPDIVVAHMIKTFPGIIEEYYDVSQNDDPFMTLEDIAIKRNLMGKGKTPDIRRAARMILKDWQTGKIVKK